MSLRVVVTYGRGSRLGTDPEGASGGIKSAILGLATGLARRGHEVHVFAPLLEAVERNGVQFHQRAGFADFAAGSTVDVLVTVPEVLPLLMPLRARARVVWTGNAHRGGDCAVTIDAGAETPGAARRPQRLYGMNLLDRHFDVIVAKSRWQADHMAGELGLPRERFRVQYNGVPLEHYGGVVPARQRNRLVYVSQARRGLDVLLRVFPRIRAQVPDAELHIFGYEYRGGESVDGDVDQPGVRLRGPASKRDLADELRSATLMAYPCTLKETFCTAVAEAQAAGLPVVTSARAALEERVAHGIDGWLVQGSPHSVEYQDQFSAAVVRLLTDYGLWWAMSHAARAKALVDYAWDRIAEGWETELLSLTAGRHPLPPPDPPDLLGVTALRLCGGEGSASPGVAEAALRRAAAGYGFDAADCFGLALPRRSDQPSTLSR